MKIVPFNDKVLVRRAQAEDRSKGGIIFPDNAKEKPKKGVVLGVGEGKFLADGTQRKLAIKVGEYVLFSSYAGTEIKVDGEDFLLIEEQDILAKVEEV